MDTTKQNVKANTTAPVNGTAPDAPAAAPAKRVREVPTVVCSPNKHQYDFIKAKVTAITAAAGVPEGMEVALAPFVLAHALKSLGYVPPAKDSK